MRSQGATYLEHRAQIPQRAKRTELAILPWDPNDGHKWALPGSQWPQRQAKLRVNWRPKYWMHSVRIQHQRKTAGKP